MDRKFLDLGRGLIHKTVPAILSAACLLVLASCGSSTNPLPTSTTGTGGGSSAPTGPTSSGLAFGCAYYSVVATDVICLTITTSSSSITADGASTATITANLTRNGSPFSGQVITFSLGATGFGTLTQTTALTSATGIATTTFTAGTTVGAVQVNVAFNTASSYVGVGLTSTGGTTPTTALSPGCAYSTVAPTTDVYCVTTGTSATSLTADGASTATITAAVTKNGSPLTAANPVIVSFTLGSTSYGTLSASTGLTNSTGQATTSFTAGTTLGAVQVTATYGNATSSVAIGLVATSSTSAAGGIQFLSASPSSIGVQGSGLQTTSSVVFKVTDASGAPISGAAVNFTMVGPGGGAYIGSTATVSPTDPNPTNPHIMTATGTTDTTGNVSVTLNSGNVAGTATITAGVTSGGTTFSASSSVLSIGGAVPSANHFSLASERLNLPGLVKDGFTTTVTVFVADRFTNAAVLSGTQVCLYTEAGAVTRNLTTDNPCIALDGTGMGTATFRTQNPMPVDTAPLGVANNSDGHVTVIAVVRGEESFVDANGNGKYDLGETFTDIGEPYVDANDNGSWDTGEFYVDTNGNGSYDAPNAKWDGPSCPAAGCDQSPNIWVAHTMMFTGDVNCSFVNGSGTSTFNVINGSFEIFTYTVSDSNGNWPVPGTTIAVALSGGGTLTGLTSVTVADAVSSGPYVGTFRVSDAAPATSAADPASVSLTVTTPSGEVASCVPQIQYGTVR